MEGEEEERGEVSGKERGPVGEVGRRRKGGG